MLVLTRRVGEAVKVGKDIVIRIRAIEGNRVKLAFDAHPEVRISRTELLKDQRG